MNHPIDIAVRAYIPLEEESSAYAVDNRTIIFSRVLVFDTETTIDQYQNLKFGSFKIYEYNKLQHQGIFYDSENIDGDELDTLKKFCAKHKVSLLKIREFVDTVFLPEVYDLKTLCVGFNLPFDLSRIALGFGYVRGRMKGGFSFTLTNNKRYPRLVIKHIDSSKSFIRFGNGIDDHNRKLDFRGNFLDLHTLTCALTGSKQTLESACKLFSAEIGKIKATQHGKITEEYILYNLNDVDATYSLYLKAKEEYDLYGLDIPLTRIYSSASLGKGYFSKMDIKPFHANSGGRISNEILGYVMSTYFGGRSEVKVRKLPMLVTLLDFLSMYPTMCILLNLWDFIVCDHIECEEYTHQTVDFLNNVSLDDFKKKETWTKLNVIVQVEPDGDILPIRARFDGKQTFNIGLPYVKPSCTQRFWYALADVLASKLLTGKTLKIVRALRFIPVGKQGGLRPITFFGKKIDPSKENFFKAVIEHRKYLQQQEKKANSISEASFFDSKQKAVKIVANATSYGIFMEINTEDREADVTVFGLEKKECRVSKIETFGKQNNVFIATFITSSARLVLGIVEAILAKHGATHAFCDTDSMAIPPQYTKEIQGFFSGLNPYDFDAPIFKVENENVIFYGISAKRYVLYKMHNHNKDIEIIKASSHGLGHLMSPFATSKKIKKEGKDEDWHKEVWLDILKLHYGLTSPSVLNEKYNRSFAVAQLTLSTASLTKRFDKLNAVKPCLTERVKPSNARVKLSNAHVKQYNQKAKPYNKQVKPFNFCIVGITNFFDEQNVKPVIPLSPYRKNAQQCPYDSFVDYESGREMKGLQYWKPFGDVMWQYIDHPESKFDGEVGVLSRKHVTINSVLHIGKESNNLEEAEVLGVQSDDYVLYGNTAADQIFSQKERILLVKPREVKDLGISRQTLFNIKRAIASGDISMIKSKTTKRLLQFTKTTKLPK
jgi:hypothetical protein